MLMKMRSRLQIKKVLPGRTHGVVVILGILVAIAVPVYNSVTDKANKKAVEANLRTIDGAIMQYMATTDDAAPVPTGGDNGNLVPEFLQAWPVGPTGASAYVIAGNGSTEAYHAEVTLVATPFGTTLATGDYSLAELKAATASGW
jgi:type IV pilus assembly protein PilA